MKVQPNPVLPAQAAAARANPAEGLPAPVEFVEEVLMRRSDVWAASDKLLALLEKQGTKVTATESLLGDDTLTISNGSDRVVVSESSVGWAGEPVFVIDDGTRKSTLSRQEDLWGNASTLIEGPGRRVTVGREYPLLGPTRAVAKEGAKTTVATFTETLLGRPVTEISANGEQLTASEAETLWGVPQVELKANGRTKVVTIAETFLGNAEISVDGSLVAPPAKPAPVPPPKAKPEPKPEPKPKPDHPWWAFWR